MSETKILSGRAFPARTSREVVAHLQVSTSHAELVSATGEVLTRLHPKDIRFDMPIGRAPRRTTLPDGTLFETEDHAGVRSLNTRSFWERLQTLEVFGPRLAIFICLAVVGAWAIWRFALPALVSAAVTMTPPSLTRAMDEGTMRTIDLTMADPTELGTVRQIELEEVFKDLVEALPEGERHRTYQLEFRTMPGMGPNAFALPGGTVVMTDALVNGFPGDDVVAGVLGHELGHIVEAHGLRQLYRSLGTYVLIALIAGDTGPILEDVLLEGNLLLSLSHSRTHERDADDFGLRLADAAGYDPAGLLEFFDSLPDAEATDGSWWSTHPPSGERIEAIRDYIANR
ncbi:MAG: M48 family metallopeptidase [Pseudomonadota bacterium]